MEHYTAHSIGHHSGMHSGVHSIWQNRKQIHEIKTRRPERFLFKNRQIRNRQKSLNSYTFYKNETIVNTKKENN